MWSDGVAIVDHHDGRIGFRWLRLLSPRVAVLRGHVSGLLSAAAF
jgi:hypothetical protein